MLLLLKEPNGLSENNSSDLGMHLQGKHCDIFLIWLEEQGGIEENRLLSVTGCKTLIDKSDLKDVDFFIGPREGTISPWSSKATDICKNCGLTSISKIEKIKAWREVGSLEEKKIKNYFDKMTESVYYSIDKLELIMTTSPPGKLREISLIDRAAFESINKDLGLGLSETDQTYLAKTFASIGRNPTDAELMMFAQVNSEHCRHKIFNARWEIDGEPQKLSPFEMIKYTTKANPNLVLSAYDDNAAVIRGYETYCLSVESSSKRYRTKKMRSNLVLKAETHNHPTAISPFPGAATGSGGEIRDEGATGRGGKPKAGFTGFSVSHLRIPGASKSWEKSRRLNPRFASPLEIMIHGPLGAASFNNEFGRPALAGYFRSFEKNDELKITIAYDKPVMLAGGLGSIYDSNIKKKLVGKDALIVVLGGPGMLIGLGGGAASSVSSGAVTEDLEYASVQRGNPEMQRRCQEVIEASLHNKPNTIETIHDVGAGGLSNAVPEILNDNRLGGFIDLRKIPTADPSLSPMEIWCNEAQERYVLLIQAEKLDQFTAICVREKAQFSVIGKTTEEENLIIKDSLLNETIINMPMSVIFEKPPRLLVAGKRQSISYKNTDYSKYNINDVAYDVLKFPGVGDKRFLITIGDRTVGGLSVRDQMVGPWQVPVADCAITASGFQSTTGEAFSLGERGPVASINGPASARLAISEAITNIAAARIKSISDISLSANWMCAGEDKYELANLYTMVEDIGLNFCPELGINIPVGKDSMSMQSTWTDQNSNKLTKSKAPVTLIASAYAPVIDTSKSLTPELKPIKDSVLFLIDLGKGRNRMGCSIFNIVCDSEISEPADCNDPSLLLDFFRTIQTLNECALLESYHDRSDGGLFVTICEMAFAGRVGVSLDLPTSQEVISFLFSEEPGAVIQVRKDNLEEVLKFIKRTPNLFRHTHLIGNLNADKLLKITSGNKKHNFPLEKLLKAFCENTHAIQSIRDNQLTANQELATITDLSDPGLSLSGFPKNLSKKNSRDSQPKVAILRDQGINGHIEMAAAFDRANFEVIDVHMSDIYSGSQNLSMFDGLAVCGGFSYGDVLGAGQGWASTIAHNPRVKEVFLNFFTRKNTFTLGVCNGCQVLSLLKDMIPGADVWPVFEQNVSGRFEARLTMVEITESPSIFLRELSGLKAPIVVSHGEGRIVNNISNHNLSCMRYIDNHGEVAQTYPANPNGSMKGVTGLTSEDGRTTIMMPHPERVFLRKQLSWLPKEWINEESPWMEIFHSARRAVQ